MDVGSRLSMARGHHSLTVHIERLVFSVYIEYERTNLSFAMTTIQTHDACYLYVPITVAKTGET